ncbi:MAG: hypothetical protein CMB56_003465 [Methanobacteriota archaeon]|nr:MAG: hypothetical protein CMB56_003465 [Euryarchaeota archaeon]|tara:strand:+ start:11386 stop:12546 length:1161 start_codon:yes stop_codon:yes gene_type:complete
MSKTIYDADSKLNILLVHVWFWPHIGGGNQHVEHIGRELVKMGHEVTVWCADVPEHDEKKFQRGGINVIRLIPKRILGGVDPVVSTNHLSIDEFDLIHLHDTLPTLIRQVLKRAKKQNKPIVTTYHNDYIKHGFIANLIKKIRWAMQGRKTLHSSNGKIVLTSFFENLLRKKGVKGDIDIIPNGFVPITDSAIRPSNLSNNVEERPTLTFIGRLSEQKGLDVLLKAWEISSLNSKPDFDLIIAGKGELKEWLDNRVNEIKFSNQIHVLGVVSEQEKQWLFENSTGIVIPSRFEGLPTVLLEAMHNKLPVIMSDVNGLGELVDNSKCGLSFNSESDIQLSKVMNELVLTSKKQLKEWGQAGNIAAEKYLWKNVTKKILELYNKILIK